TAKRVGINVSGLLFSGGYTGANQFELTVDYPTVIRELIGWFQSQPDVEVH
ncbi:MAG: polysaccharide pyruvyl transferase family protein, partial [Rhodoferax sp.]|nr:polysaccharide pyruvyl transferase family protein [Rhodoferax sp.]